MDEGTAAALAREPESVELDDATKAIVRYALGLTREPGTTSEADVEALRSAGLSDAAIHDTATITGYFNFVNRTASGLGVELEGSRGAQSADSPD